MRSDILKVVGSSTTHLNDSNMNSVNKEEKRSKKEKKNKKEKELKKEPKSSNFIQDNKQTYVENSIGSWNNKLKDKPNGIHSEVKVSSLSGAFDNTIFKFDFSIKHGYNVSSNHRDILPWL